MAFAEKEQEIRALKDEKSECERKYEALTSTLKALADGAGHVALPDAVAASGAREQDKKDERDKKDKKPVGRPLAKEEEEKNFALKVHYLGKPAVADSFGKIHEKVETPHASYLRRRREAYARLDKATRSALMGVIASGAAAAAAEEEDRRDDDEETAPEEPRSKKMKTCTIALD